MDERAPGQQDVGAQTNSAVRRAATVGAVIKVLRGCLRDGRPWAIGTLTSTVADRLGAPLRSENRRATVRAAARRLVHRGEATRRGELLRCRALIVHFFSTESGSLLPDATSNTHGTSGHALRFGRPHG